jgi:hypothetical protein
MVEYIFSAEQFTDRLDRYGPEIERWPAEVRASAATWLLTHPDARYQQARAALVAQNMRSLMQARELDSAAFGRLARGIQARKRAAVSPWLHVRPKMLAAAAMLMIAVFAGGIWTGESYNSTDDFIELASLDQPGPTDDDIDDDIEAIDLGEL